MEAGGGTQAGGTAPARPAGAAGFSYGLDPAGILTWVSPDVTGVLGWSVDDMIGRSGAELVHPDDLARGMAERAALYRRDTSATAVLRSRRKDGGYTWLALRSHPDHGADGAIVGTTVEARALLSIDDLSAVIAEAESRYRLLALNTFDVVVHQVDGVVEWVSPSVVALLGYTAEELIGARTVDLWHADDLPAAIALRDRAAGGSPGEGLFRVWHKDGRQVWLDVAAAPDGSADRPGVVVSLRDATARVAAETELRSREAEFRLIAENASDLVMRGDLDGGLVWVSPSVRHVLGYEPEDLVGGSLARLVHPDDASRRAEALDEGTAGGASFLLARYRHADGHYVWLGSTIRPERDATGAVVGRVGSAREMTREVEALRALETSEDMFRRVMSESSVGMVVVDLEGRHLAVNPAMCRIVQRDEQWLLAHTSRDIVHPAHRADTERLLAALRDGAGAGDPVLVRLLRGDGGAAWVRSTAVLVRHDDGSPHYIVIQAHDLSAERAAQDQLAYQTFHDPLTGLRNRAWLLERLEEELRAEAREGTAVGVLFLDLDNFKVVNDSLGHDAGDQLIVEIGRRIARSLRPGDHLARFGGDEFVVIVPRIDDPHVLERLAERLLATIATEIGIDGHRLVPSASVGIAVSRGGSSAASMLRDADSALSRAKSSGRARWHFVDDRMHADAVARLTVEGELRRAIAGHELVVHYQPIVSLADRRVVGHEALVRWQHPTRGLVPPLEFLPVAEDSGLIVEVGQAVLDQVCSLLASRPDLPGPISVNKSPLQISRRGWRSRFLDRVRAHGVDPQRLVVEVTETAVLALDETARDDLESLRALGVGLHVDDFGTGYSSISLLRDLPVTGLKLDASFTRRLAGGDGTADVLAAGLAGLASALHLTSIAEGVETEEQAAILVRQGWTHGQGWLFGRPQPEPFVG